MDPVRRMFDIPNPHLINFHLEKKNPKPLIKYFIYDVLKFSCGVFDFFRVISARNKEAGMKGVGGWGICVLYNYIDNASAQRYQIE